MKRSPIPTYSFFRHQRCAGYQSDNSMEDGDAFQTKPTKIPPKQLTINFTPSYLFSSQTSQPYFVNHSREYPTPDSYTPPLLSNLHARLLHTPFTPRSTARAAPVLPHISQISTHCTNDTTQTALSSPSPSSHQYTDHPSKHSHNNTPKVRRYFSPTQIQWLTALLHETWSPAEKR